MSHSIGRLSFHILICLLWAPVNIVLELADIEHVVSESELINAKHSMDDGSQT